MLFAVIPISLKAGNEIYVQFALFDIELTNSYKSFFKNLDSDDVTDSFFGHLSFNKESYKFIGIIFNHR